MSYSSLFDPNTAMKRCEIDDFKIKSAGNVVLGIKIEGWSEIDSPEFVSIKLRLEFELFMDSDSIG